MNNRETYQYQLLEKLSFNRFGGTEDELKAAKLLLGEIESFGGKGEIMDFTIPAYTIEKAAITVTAEVEGRRQNIATHTFRVRKLPDPTPYLAIGTDRYKGGKPIGKQAVAGAGGLKAAIDDGLLDIQFQVLSFEMIVFDSMGNAIPEVSAGAAFSERQKEAIKRLGRGKRFFISRIKAKGPDGVERTLSPMEILIN